MNKLYAFGFHPPFETTDYIVLAVDKDLNVIAHHLSSSPSWVKHDLGVSTEQDTGSAVVLQSYMNIFPNGYEIYWLGYFDSESEAMLYLEKVLKKNVDTEM